MTAITVESAQPSSGREIFYRHSLAVRLTHWIGVLAISLLLMSGLNIFNAHPHLYWGAYGADHDRPWFELTVENTPAGSRGVARLDGREVTTTGLLGLSRDAQGRWSVQGFPDWATLPSHRDLATARRWHFFLAWILVFNGAVYFLTGLVSGHLRRDLALTGDDIRVRNIWRSIVDHVRLRHPTGEAARRYNVLQKFAYLVVIAILVPAMVLSGLAMSPGVDSAWPWLVELFGGRPSARSIHFIVANLVVLFVVVHVVEVFLAGVWNELRSMITGRYVVPSDMHG